MKNETAVALLVAGLAASIAASAAADVVEWDFPRLGSCHEGLAFSDGTTGVLVWGGGREIRLTVGRADLWDHRGGYPWLATQSYANIVSLVRAGRSNELRELFKKETPAGEPRNPYMMPLGRVVVALKGEATLSRGELDPKTGVGRLFLSDGKAIELAMGARSHLFMMKFDAGVDWQAEVRHCMEFPSAKRSLEAVGVKPAEKWAKDASGGFLWRLPNDTPVSLVYGSQGGGELAVATARGESAAVARGSFAAVRAESVARWQAFWAKSATVKVPDPVIQQVFDYGMYRFGAMTDPDGVPAGLQGPWLEDDKLVPWNGDYHFNINVQECYSPAYRGGHFANLMPLFKMVLGWRPLLRDNAKKFVGIDDGYVLPHSVDDRGVCIGGFWTGTIDHASTAWVASMMYRYVKYSGDVAFLREYAYDFMKGAMSVYRRMFEEKDGRLSMPLGPSPEWCGADVRKAVGRNPSFQLAAAHRLARDLVAAAAQIGEAVDPMWLDVDRRLPAYTAGDTGIELFEGQSLTESHRHHSHLAGFYPFDTIDFASARASRLVDKSFSRWVRQGTGQWSGWCVPWAAILNVHFGAADAAVQRLRDWETYFSDDGHGSHHNSVRDGFTSFTNGLGVMQMDGQCAAVTAVMELMVHEISGKPEFFRGCPSRWKEVSFENIRLSDGTSVSGSRINGVVKLSR